MMTMTHTPATLEPTAPLDPTLPPAVALPLTGRFLIEASAGTGKTWTLTGIVLRLLIEAGQPCDKIIATTFTKSAAAEMRQRIRERLQVFSRLLRLITQDSWAYVIDNTADITVQQAQLWQWLEGRVANINDDKLTEGLTDPINKHLIALIAKQSFLANHSLNASTLEPTPNPPNPAKPTLTFRIALQRTTTALNQLDRLFVSTLDSLCQKWLREFSSDTGYSPDVQISNDVKPIILAMIHDRLRAFWAIIEAQSPELYRLMTSQGKLFKPEDFYKAVEKALDFYTAEIDEVAMSPLDLAGTKDLIQQITTYHLDEAFANYFDADYRLEMGMAKKNLHNKFDTFHEIQKVLRKEHLDGLFELSSDARSFLTAVANQVETGNGFKKGFEYHSQQFNQQPIIQQLSQLAMAIEGLEQHINQLNAFFTQFVSRYVRDQLPKLLEAQRLTTFSLQLARLNRALAGRQGDALARYIRHQYPIALIDESQDVNTEQALLIQRIYLDKTLDNTDKTDAKRSKKSQQALFLLLVGDPKQAIYGFRGGDVHNYTTLKQQFETKPIALLENYRSAKTLIDSLNQWYGVADMSDGQSEAVEQTLSPSDPYFMGEQIFYRKVSAKRGTSKLRSVASDTVLPALFYLNVPYQYPLSADSEQSYVTVADAIATQILALIDTSGADKDKNRLLLDNKPLTINHFCVLARYNKELTAVEKALHSKGIATLRSGNHSVFDDVMSADLQVLMSAMLNPYHQGKLKTLLMTKFFGLSLTEANAVLQQESKDNRKNPLAVQISDLLVRAGELWQKEGFLVAIQWLLPQSLKMPKQTFQTFWQRLASDTDGERLLIDLRQLLDILSDVFAVQKTGVGEYQLFDWYCEQRQRCPQEEWALQQRLPSEQGVQLMTIHRSKGLEFPIVFVVGLDSGLSKKTDKHTLYLYSNSDDNSATQQPPKTNPLLNRRLSPVATNDKKAMDYQAIQNTSDIYESLRLMYVALTRAKERVYIVTQAQAPVKDSKATVTAPLKNFISDNKSFALNQQASQAATLVNINSLSKYFDKTNQRINLQNTNEQNKTQSIGYESHYQTIKKLSFMGWANTSFTALARFVTHDRYNVAVHEADYDGFADILNNTLQNDAENNLSHILESTIQPVKKSPIKGLWDLTQPKPEHNNLADFEYPQTNELDNAYQSQTPPHIPEVNPEDWQTSTLEFEPMFNPTQSFTEVPDFYFSDELNHSDIVNDFYNIMDNGNYHNERYSDTNSDNHVIPAIHAEPILSPPIPTFLSESELLRFNFEKGASAGTFLHKVLEDLANHQYDNSSDDNGRYTENTWLPPKRWAVMIDRVLRSQQLPSQYYSTEHSANNVVVKFAEMTEEAYQKILQPDYVALTQWLNEVIHTPFIATGQRPIEIRHSQKSAEMGFNMRLQGELSLKKLNELFAEEGIELNLQENHYQSSVWQYLRGEIDLVYQHNGRFYIVDYKSNFLGNTFAHYQADNLVQAMDEHRYWLQASIYQVALHRFLQLRLPDYDMATHLGAVEYAFIRGMSPQYATGRLVWQPDNQFIQKLDNLFYQV